MSSSQEKFKCSKCRGIFKIHKNLIQHMKTHETTSKNFCSDTSIHFCSLCKKSVKDLGDHIKNVHSERKFICGFEGCKKKFAKKNGLNRHLMTHNDGFKQYECPECLRVFVEKIQLERHFKIHLKPKKITSFQCEECLRYFNRAAELKRHVKTIHQEKLHECALCPSSRRFGNKFEVLRHFKTVHLGQKIIRKKQSPKVPLEDIVAQTIIEENVQIEFHYEETEILEKVELVEAADKSEDVMYTEVELAEEIHWDCQRCHRRFENLERLKLHNNRNHNWKCVLCQGGQNSINIYQRKEDFELHHFECHKMEFFPDKIECPVCHDLFANSRALHNHQSNEHGMVKER